MPSKPSQSEAEFFAREESEKLHRLAEAQRREKELSEREHNRALHFMKCPECGANLKKARIGRADVEECTECDTLVLHKSELEKVKVSGHNLLKSILDVFHNDA
jgi:hypothetical protein